MPETKCGCIAANGRSGQDNLVAVGPTLLVDIGFDATYDPALRRPPVAGRNALWALVDTGASRSCIDNNLAAELALPVTDRQVISGSGGRHTVNVYLAQIFIPSLNHAIYGNFSGVELAAGGQTHRALIGRDVLRAFTMLYNGVTGDVTLTL